MKANQIIYDCNTKQIKIEEIEVDDVIEESLVSYPTIDEQILEIKNVNQMQDEIIDIQLMATDELYMILEPLLSEIQVCNLGGSKMVEMYVCMVQRGLKTIEEVPLRYREEVRMILEQLEK